MAAAAILDFCTIWILPVNLSAGPHFQPMFQIRCKCVQKWPSYGPKYDFQYGGHRHLGFCWIRVLRVKAARWPYSRCLYQIWCKSVQKYRRNGRLTDFKMAAAAILDFCTMWIFVVNLTVGPHFQPVTNLVKMRATMAELWPKMWFSIWRPPPSWILSDTSSEGKSCPGTLFLVSAVKLTMRELESWGYRTVNTPWS